jgi:biopolymer transport protein TolR
LRYPLQVCLVALTLATGAARPVARQSPVVTSESSFSGIRKEADNTPRAAQTMQRGISLELPVTHNAVPMPDADREESLVVSVTKDGSVYFGVDPISLAVLADTIKDRLSNRAEKKLYIKADARTPFTNVVRVLGSARTAGVVAPNLLTAQRDSSEPGTLVPPKGLAVLVGPALPLGSVATVVQMVNSGQRWPTLKINNEQIPWASLRSALGHILQDRGELVVRVKAEGTLPFAEVVDVTDICRSNGADVVLVVPGL